MFAAQRLGEFGGDPCWSILLFLLMDEANSCSYQRFRTRREACASIPTESAIVDGVGNVRLPELMFSICEEELALLNVGPSVNKLVSVGICFDPRVDIVFIYFKL